jgi:transposase-like protein
VVYLLAVVGRIGENLAEEGGTRDMEEKQIATIGSFCLNEACEEYQKVNHGNMMKYGKTEKGVRRYRCKTCKKTFTETKGTMFYRCRHSEEEIVECMQMVGDRNSLAAIHRIKGIKEETVCNWLERAASHVEQFEEEIVRKRKLSRVQTDALWTYVGHKGEKGGGQRKKPEEHFGAEQPSTWTPV